MNSADNRRGLAGFIDQLKAQPYYFAGRFYTRVSNVVPFPLLADAEFLYADNGISLDGVLRYDSGRPWKRFEILLPWAQNTLDFARIEISLDTKAVADGMAYFFRGGAHVQFQGEEFAGSAQLEFKDENRIELNGMLSVGATIYGFDLTGGLTRHDPDDLGNVVSLRRPT